MNRVLSITIQEIIQLLYRLHTYLSTLGKNVIYTIIFIIIIINIIVYVQDMVTIRFIFFNIIGVASIIVVSYLFGIYNDDILDKTYLNMLFGISLMGYFILNDYFGLQVTRMILLTIPWLLLLFEIRLLNQRVLNKIISFNIQILHYLVMHKTVFLIISAMIGLIHILFVMGKLYILIKFIYVIIIVLSLNIIYVIRMSNNVQYGHSLGVRYFGGTPDEFMKMMSQIPRGRIAATFLGAGVLTIIGVGVEGYIQYKLNDLKSGVGVHEKNLADINTSIKLFMDDRNDLLKRFELSKDKDLRTIIHSEIKSVTENIKTLTIKKIDLLKPISQIELPVSKIEQPGTIKSEKIG